MAKSAVTAKDSRARAARPKKKRPRSVPAERLLKVGLAAVRTLTAGFVAASKLLVVSINGVAPAAGLSTNRPCTIIGVQGYGTTSCVVTCNLYGAASSAPTTINA